MPELECVALQHLSEESLRSCCTLLSFSGVARGKRVPRRDFSSGRGQEDEPSETAVMQKGQQSLPKPTELGLCPEGGLPAADSGPIQFGCIMILKLIRNQSLRLETNTNILLTEQTSRFCQLGSY